LLHLPVATATGSGARSGDVSPGSISKRKPIRVPPTRRRSTCSNAPGPNRGRSRRRPDVDLVALAHCPTTAASAIPSRYGPAPPDLYLPVAALWQRVLQPRTLPCPKMAKTRLETTVLRVVERFPSAGRPASLTVASQSVNPSMRTRPWAGRWTSPPAGPACKAAPCRAANSPAIYRESSRPPDPSAVSSVLARRSFRGTVTGQRGSPGFSAQLGRAPSLGGVVQQNSQSSPVSGSGSRKSRLREVIRVSHGRQCTVRCSPCGTRNTVTRRGTATFFPRPSGRRSGRCRSRCMPKPIRFEVGESRRAPALRKSK